MKISKTTSPEAYITSGKNRMKQFEDKVYLKNGQTFEIELYNPTKDTVKAVIYLNNKPISSSGIVLKPAQRVFLERYIDSNNKFLFETYHVNDTETNREATADNGMLKVEFYRAEQEVVYNGPRFDWTWDPNRVYGSPNDTGGYRFYTNDFNTITNNGQLSLFDNSSDGSTLTFTNTSMDINFSRKLLETGRVEKGERSAQSFDQYIGKFGAFAFETVTWMLLPESRKPITVTDVNKVYCTGCGTRRKKQSWVHCPSCGTKF